MGGPGLPRARVEERRVLSRYSWDELDYVLKGEEMVDWFDREASDAAIDEAIGMFPETFKLRRFPGEIFSISRAASYVNDRGEVLLYVYILNREDNDRYGLKKGEWSSFAKGTVEELESSL